MEQLTPQNNIIKIQGTRPGKTIAIFACVHGDEPIGLLAIERVLKDLTIEAGAVYFVLANPRAYKNNVRMIDSDLNRSFQRKKNPQTYEEKRAEELMDILDTCDALLDLHSASPTIPPFAITFKNTKAVSKYLPVRYVSYGWYRKDPNASEEYMHRQGKVGICVELRSKQQTRLAATCILNFLKYFGCIPGKETLKKNRQKYSEITQKLLVQTTDFYEIVKKILK